MVPAGMRIDASTDEPLWVQLTMLSLQEERDDSLAEAGAHPGQVDGGEVDESTVAIEASLQEQKIERSVKLFDSAVLL